MVQVSCTFGLPVQAEGQREELIGANMDMVKNSKTKKILIGDYLDEYLPKPQVVLKITEWISVPLEHREGVENFPLKQCKK